MRRHRGGVTRELHVSLLLAAGLFAFGAGLTLPAAAIDPPPAPPLLYTLPEAGSYELPVIDRVGQHRLIDAAGQPRSVLDAPADGCALVAFVYLHCTDARGCPLALASLQQVDRAIAARPDLRERVRLVTVSFDPDRDTPESMQGLRHHMAPKGEWSFLTGASRAAVEPVLVDFGQDAVPVLTEDGSNTGLMRHVAKVFLVDPEGGVRNVYSSGFLDYRLLLRDVETLLQGE